MSHSPQQQHQSPKPPKTGGGPPPGPPAQATGPLQVKEVFKASPNVGSGSVCESVIIFFSIVLIVLTMPFSLCVCFLPIQEYQRAVVLRLGRLKGQKALGPGLVFYIPCTDEFYVVDMRVKTYDIIPQDILTKDSVSIRVDAVIYHRIVAPVTAICNVTDYNNSTVLFAQTAMRAVLGQFTLAQILSEREAIALKIEVHIAETAMSWGVLVDSVEIKDVVLPITMQRSMAAEAEAQREANAKIIVAEGEKAASSALRDAAKNMEDSPGALQLRYLQTLNVVAAENNSTIVFPIPLDFLGFYKK